MCKSLLRLLSFSFFSWASISSFFLLISSSSSFISSDFRDNKWLFLGVSLSLSFELVNLSSDNSFSKGVSFLLSKIIFDEVSELSNRETKSLILLLSGNLTSPELVFSKSELDFCFLTCLKALIDSEPVTSWSRELSRGVEKVTLFFIAVNRLLGSAIVLMTGFSEGGPLFRLIKCMSTSFSIVP
jgi:hypothetical protein